MQVNLVKINRDVGRDADLVLPNCYEIPIQSFPLSFNKRQISCPPRLTYLFILNAVTSLRSGLSNTGLENVIYCSTTTDAGPIQNFTATSLSSSIPYYMKDIYQVNCTIQLFNLII